MKKLLTLIVALYTATAMAAPLKQGLKPMDLRSFGSENAPARIYVFTSLSCPHCSIYHQKVMPRIQSEFIDTNQAELVIVDMAFDGRAMAGTLLARCLPATAYAPFISTMFENQDKWGYGPNARQLITGYAKMLGMTDTDINTCLSDKALQQKIADQRDNLSQLYKVSGMPTTVLVKDGKHKSFVGTTTDVIIAGIKKGLE